MLLGEWANAGVGVNAGTDVSLSAITLDQRCTEILRVQQKLKLTCQNSNTLQDFIVWATKSAHD